MKYRFNKSLKTALGIAAGLCLLQPSVFADTLLHSDFSALLGEGTPTDSSSIEKCEQMARMNGNGKASPPVHISCVNKYLSKALPNAVKQTDDQSIFAFAAHSVLVMRKKGRTEFFAGPNTHLSNPRAIAIDQLNNEIAVLDGENTIYIFSSLFGGNVTPRRIIETRALQGSTAIAIDTKNNEILVSYEDGAIKAFPRMIAPIGRTLASTASEIRATSGNETQIQSGASLAIDADHGELFVLDKTQGQISVFDLAAIRAGGVKALIPKRIIAGSATGLSSPQVLSYFKGTDQLEVLQSNGVGGWTSRVFARISHGNVAPVSAPTK